DCSSEAKPRRTREKEAPAAEEPAGARRRPVEGPGRRALWEPSEAVAEAHEGGAPVLEVAFRAGGRVAIVVRGERLVTDVADLQVQRQAFQRTMVEGVVHLCVLHGLAGDADGLVVGAETAGLAAEVRARAPAVADREAAALVVERRVGHVLRQAAD